MKKGSVMGLFVLALLMTVSFVGTASAQSLGGQIFDPVKDMFASWTEGDLSVNLAKYVLLLVLTLFIFTILDFVPFVKEGGSGKKFIRFVLALAIGFLSMAYLTPSDVYTALAAYSALGVVFSAVVPFLILAFFSMEVAKSGGAGRILSKGIWIAFGVFLIYKIIDGIFFCTIGTKGAQSCISVVEGFIYIGVLVLIVLGSY